MNIQKLLGASSADMRTLAQRLSVQRSATHDPSDKADLQEWIEDLNQRAGALAAMSTAYGPIIQSAIDTGLQGNIHRIRVEKFTGDLVNEWVDVSVHEFTIE